MISIQILGLNDPERYAVRRLVMAAHKDLHQDQPGLELEVTEVADPSVIGKYACFLILPTLVINGQVVCSGRFPGREEVTDWLREAARSGGNGHR